MLFSDLLRNLTEERAALEEELGVVSGRLHHRAQLRSLAVAAENVVKEQQALQTRTVPVSEV